MARILILLSSCLVLALPAGCVKRVHVTKHPLVVHCQPVKLTLKREGFDAVQRIGELVDGIVHVDGEPVTDNFQYQDAVVLVRKE